MKTSTKLALVLVSISMLFAGCKKNVVAWNPSPPVAGLETPFETYSMDASSANALKVGFDSKLEIPADAFTDSLGNKVTGKIDIKYREFHMATDIFLSGIPMTFNSQGQKRPFETAGMFEIQALQNGKKLKLAESKSIDVRFGSKYGNEDYSLFQLNSESGTWEWVDLPKTEPNIEKQKRKDALKDKLPSMKVPLGNNYFILNYNQLIDIYYGRDKSAARKNFKNKALRNRFAEYGIKFYDLNSEGEVLFGKAYYHPSELIWKDLDGKEIPKRLANFNFDWVKSGNTWIISNFSLDNLGNNKYRINYTDKSGKFSKEMEAFMPIKSLIRLPAKTWIANYDSAMKMLEKEQLEIDLMAEAYRTFKVNNLGIYNCDRLLKDDNWVPVIANFTINNVDEKTNQLILIFGDNSGCITYAPEGFASIKINPESKHRMFMILPNQEIAIFPVENLMGISADSLRAIQNPKYTFAMQNQGKVADAISFRKMLGF